MSEFYRAKLSELTKEFTRYLIQYPESAASLCGCVNANAV